jgi:polar amino acid transport system substrate-binding protein
LLTIGQSWASIRSSDSPGHRGRENEEAGTVFEGTISRREMLKRSAFVGIAAAAGPGLLAACSSSGASTNSLSGLRKQGYVRVGFANEAPYGYADASGKLTGEAPTVARAIMKKLGVPEVQGVLTEFGSLIPGLIAKRFDMIAAGMFITPERCGQILFSNPDYIAAEGLAVPKGNPKNLSDYQSVASSGIKLGVETGAVEGDYAKQAGVKDSQIQQFPNGPTGMQALKSGRIDAFSLTAISLNYLVSSGGYSGFDVVSFVPTDSSGKKIQTGGGYGFRKGSEDLVNKFNQQLAAMQKSGELAKLVAPFGFNGPTLAGAVGLTSAQMCKAST